MKNNIKSFKLSLRKFTKDRDYIIDYVNIKEHNTEYMKHEYYLSSECFKTYV